MVERMIDSATDKEKYSTYLVRSYVEGNKKAKWCPVPGCDFAVIFDIGSENKDVCCKCGHAFCWNCGEKAHRPVACETVAKWILKNRAESENTTWILATSKPCPKCQRPIEKNQGCMHMSCRPPCNFQFCWTCLGSWSSHVSGSCNRFHGAQQNMQRGEEEMRRKAKMSSDRYTHYWERWAANQKSTRKALADLENMRTDKMEEIRAKLSLPVSQLNFVIEAWEQIVECRRILTWTYAYGYYFPEQEHAKRELFEYLQGEAEAMLERLHKCTEMDLQAYFAAETLSATSQEFLSSRIRLAGLTNVTGNYFGNLVLALDNGLEEVDSKRKIAARRRRPAPCAGIITYEDYEDYREFWPCNVCTYVSRVILDSCEMRGSKR